MNTKRNFLSNRNFDSQPAEEKIAFYIHYRNFREAIGLIKSFSPLNLDYKILLVKLSYWEGNEDEAKDIIDEILSDYSNDFRVVNKIGDLYLKELIRVEDALSYYRKSLEIHKNQPQILSLIIHLTDYYLKKLKKFWIISALFSQYLFPILIYSGMT